jgi:hypothetical protein
MRIVTLSILVWYALLFCSNDISSPAARIGESSAMGYRRSGIGESASISNVQEEYVEDLNRRAEAAATTNISSINEDPMAPCPKCVRIFNGTSFEGWEASPSTWSIADGAMRGQGGTSRAAYTKTDYGSFRLVVTSRMNPVNGDHLGILFWGNHPADPDKPQIDLAGWIQFMPPHGAMWDYHPPQHHNLPHETLVAGSRDFTNWNTTEILCNLEKGTMRAAVNGVETTRYTHPYPRERIDPLNRIVNGPIGMMRHGGGASEYKWIYVETDPIEDKLYTVK